jgi:hypothetical protein
LIHTQKLQNPQPRSLPPRSKPPGFTLSILTHSSFSTNHTRSHHRRLRIHTASKAAPAPAAAPSFACLCEPWPCYIPFAFVFLIYDGPSIFIKALFAYRNNLTFPSPPLPPRVHVLQGDENLNPRPPPPPRPSDPPTPLFSHHLLAYSHRLLPFKFYYNKEIFPPF